MSKLIFERRKENQLNANKNLQNKSIEIDKDSSSFIDKSNISESVFNIKEEYNTNLKTLDEYKKEIDRIFELKKTKLDSAFEIDSEENTDNMEQKYDEELEEEMKKEKIKLETDYEKKKKNLEEEYNKKTEKEKLRIKKEIEYRRQINIQKTKIRW